MQQSEFARQLRKNQTEAENRLWYYLRKKQLNGIKFRRQYICGAYIVDFVSIEKRLIIKLDGGQHNDLENKEYDSKRTNFLKLCGFKVIRFWDNEIFENIDGVLEVIQSSLSTSP